MALPCIVSGGGIAINVISIAVVVDIVFVSVFVIRKLNNRIKIFSVTALEVNASASRMLLDRNAKGGILILILLLLLLLILLLLLLDRNAKGGILLLLLLLPVIIIRMLLLDRNVKRTGLFMQN